MSVESSRLDLLILWGLLVDIWYLPCNTSRLPYWKLAREILVEWVGHSQKCARTTENETRGEHASLFAYRRPPRRSAISAAIGGMLLHVLNDDTLEYEQKIWRWSAIHHTRCVVLQKSALKHENSLYVRLRRNSSTEKVQHVSHSGAPPDHGDGRWKWSTMQNAHQDNALILQCMGKYQILARKYLLAIDQKKCFEALFWVRVGILCFI